MLGLKGVRRQRNGKGSCKQQHVKNKNKKNKIYFLHYTCGQF